jgi:hypothetical protein
MAVRVHRFCIHDADWLKPTTRGDDPELADTGADGRERIYAIYIYAWLVQTLTGKNWLNRCPWSLACEAVHRPTPLCDLRLCTASSPFYFSVVLYRIFWMLPGYFC